MKHRPLWILVALWVGMAGEAVAYEQVIPLESPDWFVQAFGGYGYAKTSQETVEDGSSSLTLFEETERGWIAGGSAMIPIVSRLGTRLRVDGGRRRISEGTLAGDLGTVTAGGELFLRDPTKGQIAAGYAYTWSSPDASFAEDSVRVHTLPVFASLYTPDLGGGATDWTVSFTYDWIELRLPVGTENQWAYAIDATSTWYVTRFVDFRGGFRYSRLIGDAPSNTMEGVFALEALVPSGVRNYGTVALTGSVGRVEDEDLAAPFYTVSRLTWGIGVTVSVHFPGVTSLVELNRAYR
jgi:hypothetical protein